MTLYIMYVNGGYSQGGGAASFQGVDQTADQPHPLPMHVAPARFSADRYGRV